jgi:hypothetical protein
MSPSFEDDTFPVHGIHYDVLQNTSMENVTSVMLKLECNLKHHKCLPEELCDNLLQNSAQVAPHLLEESLLLEFIMFYVFY